MILRLTEKLGKKIHEKPSRSVPIAENPFADWTANLFTLDRTQYIIIANTLSLYSVIFFGRQITDSDWLIKRMVSTLRDFLGDDGFGIIYNELIAGKMGSVRFSKTRDRRVIGSLTELIQEAEMHLAEDELSPYQTAFRLNDRRLSLLDYGCPRDAFRGLVDKMGESRTSSG